MRATSSQRRSFDWTLDPEAFGRFLVRLDPDLGVAARRYETMRERLIRLFEWRGCSFAEDLADQTIDRVIRKCNEGLELTGDHLLRYSAGVARHIAQEHWRNVQREQIGKGDADKPPFVPGRHSTTDLRLSSLEEGLERLSNEERSIILRYYFSKAGDRIANRKALAEELGVRANTLRIRAYRIRAKLFDAIQQHIQPHDPSSAATND